MSEQQEQSLEQIFQGKGESTEAEAAPEPEAAPESKADDAEPAEAAPEVEPKADDEPRMAPLQALQDERAKRQQAEQRLDVLEAQLQALSSKPEPAQEPETAPDPTTWIPDDADFFDDPKGTLTKALSAQADAFGKQLNQLHQQTTQGMTDMRAYFSEQAARARHDDFDDKVASFKAELKNNPALLAQAQAHPDPAAFVYEVGRQAELVARFKDPDRMRAEIEKQVRAELQKSEATEKRKKTPGSITDTGSGRDASQTFKAPSLREIFNGR